MAAAILEVLGGVLRPGDAATALSVTLARYYQLEARALGGLVQACEPRGKGRGPRKDHPERELEALKQNVTRLQQECARYAALVRVSQRNAGLPPVPVKSKTDPKGRKARKPAVRALLAVKRMAVEGGVPGVIPAGSGDARPVPV